MKLFFDSVILKIETSLNLFFFIYFQGSEFSRSAFRCHENSDPGKQIKKNDFKLVSILLSKMFYGHAMFIGGNSQKGTRYYLSFPVYRCRVRGYKNWLQFEQHYSHSVFNFYFFGKKIRRQMSSNVLKLKLHSARWIPKLVSFDAQS